MAAKFWLFISILMHPLLLISYTFAILFYVLPYYKMRFFEDSPFFLLLYVFANTFLLPTFAVLVLRKIKTINSIYLNERTERHIPYILTSIFCIITSWQLYFANVGELSYRFMFGVSGVIVAVTIINFWYKISAHAAAAAGVVALLFYTVLFLNAWDMLFWFFGALFLTGLSAASRLFLGVHKKSEIYWGFLLGFIIVFISVAV